MELEKGEYFDICCGCSLIQATTSFGSLGVTPLAKGSPQLVLLPAYTQSWRNKGHHKTQDSRWSIQLFSTSYWVKLIACGLGTGQEYIGGWAGPPKGGEPYLCDYWGALIPILPGVACCGERSTRTPVSNPSPLLYKEAQWSGWLPRVSFVRILA